MESTDKQFAHYRKAYNPLQLLRCILQKPKAKTADLRRLVSFFELERARRVKLQKEDAFIEEALRQFKQEPEPTFFDGSVLLRLLEERKLFLVQSIDECFRNNIEIHLEPELYSLLQLMSALKQRCIPKKQPVKQNPVSFTKRPFLRKAIQASCWLRQKSGIKPQLNPCELLQQEQFQTQTDILNKFDKQNTMHTVIRKASNLIPKRNSTEPGEINFMGGNGNNLEKTMKNPKRQMSRTTSSNLKPKSAQNHTRITTSATVGSLARINRKTTNNKSMFKNQIKLNQKPKRGLDDGSSVKVISDDSNFSELMESEADAGDEESDTVSQTQMGYNSKPSFQLKRSSSFARHAKSSFMFHNRISANAKFSVLFDDKNTPLLQQTEYPTVPAVEQEEVTSSSESIQNFKTQQVCTEFQSSRGVHSRMMKLTCQTEVPESSGVFSSTLKKPKGINRFQANDQKVTYSKRSSIIGTRPKSKDVQSRSEKRTRSYNGNNYFSYIQNLYEKFAVFSEDKTILSFKEVKGFLRETFDELKKLSPSFSVEQLAQCICQLIQDQLLLKQKESTLKSKIFPSLTMDDLVKLITELADLNAKEYQKAQDFPGKMLYRDGDGHSLRLKKLNPNKCLKNNRAMFASNLRKMFNNQTAELRELFKGSDNHLKQTTPESQVDMEVMNRWCAFVACKIKSSDKQLKRRGRRL